jgi:hypothetical protein
LILKITSDLASEKVLYEIDPNVSIYVPDDEEESEDDLLAVSQKEFEKEYEVK